MAATTYSTWDYYHSTYGGKLSETAYTQQALGAKAEIDRRTFGRARNAPGEIAGNLCLCECELLDVLHAFGEIPAGVASISNDGYSIDYGSRSTSANIETEASAAERICRKHLTMPVNLMFAGGCICFV